MGERRGIVFVLVLVLGGGMLRPLHAQEGDAPPRWEIGAGFGLGSPSGWVQVREDTVTGTRLSLGGSLGVHQVQTAAFDLAFRPSDGARYAFAITAYELDGSAVPAAPVHFNGTTLAGGATLLTRTRFANFVAARVTGAWRVARPGGGDLRVSAGLSFVALTFVLQGTLAAGSATRETQEDFVTQELPVPVIGAEYSRPLGGALSLEASLAGGWLPWANSLRKEGGTVTITQTELSASLGARYAVAPALLLEGALRYAGLAQNEQSAEDGNQIKISATTVMLGLVGRY